LGGVPHCGCNYQAIATAHLYQEGFLSMTDRSTSAAHRAPALIAILVLAGSGRLARADEPTGETPTPDASVEAGSEATPVQPDGGLSSSPDTATSMTAPATAAPAAAGLAPASEPAATASALPAPTAPEVTGPAWFARPRLAMTVGVPSRSFKLRFFGFLAADYMFDTTRSYDDSMGTLLVARTDTYENHHGRSQFSIKSTRLGFGFESPSVGEFSPSAVIESDFAGSQSTPPGTTPAVVGQALPARSSEAVYFASPIFRIRHAYVKIKSPYVDLLLGHTFDVFGWQNYFDPSGVRNQLYSRNPQLRLSREFNVDEAVTFEVAAAAVRPVQRDSGVPDGSAGLRVSFNGWQGIRTPGNERIVANPLTLGVSGIVRQFKLNAFTQPPVQSSNSVLGWGISFDAFLPIIPASNFVDRGNRLALLASFVKGAGIGDLLSLTGGAKFPILFRDQWLNPPLHYEANADNGLVSFDEHGVLHAIEWTAFRVGLQYYLPTTGRWIFSANYTQAYSPNMAALFPDGGAETGDLQYHVADTFRYADAKLTFDVTPVVRVGVAGQYTQTVYVDDDKPHNIRVSANTIYLF
jgi:hypothetical protein